MINVTTSSYTHDNYALTIITLNSTHGMKTSKIIKTIHTIIDEIATPIKLKHTRVPLIKAFGLL